MEICSKLLTLNRQRMAPSNGAPAPLLHDHAARSTMARPVELIGSSGIFRSVRNATATFLPCATLKKVRQFFERIPVLPQRFKQGLTRLGVSGYAC